MERLKDLRSEIDEIMTDPTSEVSVRKMSGFMKVLYPELSANDYKVLASDIQNAQDFLIAVGFYVPKLGLFTERRSAKCQTESNNPSAVADMQKLLVDPQMGQEIEKTFGEYTKVEAQPLKRWKGCRIGGGSSARWYSKAKHRPVSFKDPGLSLAVKDKVEGLRSGAAAFFDSESTKLLQKWPKKVIKVEQWRQADSELTEPGRIYPEEGRNAMEQDERVKGVAQMRGGLEKHGFEYVHCVQNVFEGEKTVEEMERMPQYRLIPDLCTEVPKQRMIRDETLDLKDSVLVPLIDGEPAECSQPKLLLADMASEPVSRPELDQPCCSKSLDTCNIPSRDVVTVETVASAFLQAQQSMSAGQQMSRGTVPHTQMVARSELEVRPPRQDYGRSGLAMSFFNNGFLHGPTYSARPDPVRANTDAMDQTRTVVPPPQSTEPPSMPEPDNVPLRGIGRGRRK